MFIVVYRYQVPAEKTKRYVYLQKQTTQLYLDHGCLDIEVYRDAADPQYWMEIYKFVDRQHYEDVVSAIEKDSRIEPVTREFSALFNVGEYRPEKSVYYRMM